MDAPVNVITVRCPEPGDATPQARYTLEMSISPGEVFGPFGFREARDMLISRTGTTGLQARDILLGVRGAAAPCHVGPVTIESHAFGTAVICKRRHMVDFFPGGEWAGSRAEETYTDPGYVHACFGAGGEEPR